MKSFPTGLSNLLATGTTTLCRCWKVTRQDDAVFGFTDHDRTLTIDGVDYAPETGFTPSEVEQTLGLAVDTQEVDGALSSDVISEDDIALGRWDDAAIEILVVDWTDVAHRAVLRAGSLGEIRRGDIAFTTEMRGLAHRLNQEIGKTFTRVCSAVVGDANCGIDLTDPAYAGSGAVVDGGDRRIFTVSGLGPFAPGWFARGVLTWTSGVNDWAKAEGAVDAVIGDGTPARSLSLWQRAARPIAVGDTFTITAGCPKTWDVCRSKFSNGVNFRGFPHMSGNDFALSVAKRSGPNDGGSFFN